MNKEVNVKLQCLASLFVPTGLYAFKRIKKLTIGIIIYAVTYLAWLGQNILFMPDFNNPSSVGLYGLTSLLIVGLGILLPLIFIYNYSIDYNKKIKKESPIV